MRPHGPLGDTPGAAGTGRSRDPEDHTRPNAGALDDTATKTPLLTKRAHGVDGMTATKMFCCFFSLLKARRLRQKSRKTQSPTLLQSRRP